MSMPDLISATGPAKLYVALNPITTRPAGHRNPSTFADLCQMYLTVARKTALSTELFFTNLNPSTNVATLHIAALLPRVCPLLQVCLIEKETGWDTA